MRVVFAPDKFAGTLTAVEAAAAMARGWARRAPGDELVQVPMSDGGPGFVDVLHTALGGDLHAVTVTGPYGEPDPGRGAASWAGRRTSRAPRPSACTSPTRAGSRLPSARTPAGSASCSTQALDDRRRPDRRRARRLGDERRRCRACSPPWARPPREATSTPGRRGSPTSPRSTSAPCGERFDGVDLVMASDVDNPLLGINGATKIYGPQKGLPEERLVTVDGWLQHFAELTDRKVAAQKGAGAAGGLGFALMLLGGHSYAGRDARVRGGRAGRPPGRGRPRGHRGGGLRLLLALGQGAVRGGRGRQPRRWCRASRWPGRC